MLGNKALLLFAFILNFLIINSNNSYILIDFLFKNIIIENPICLNKMKKYNKYRGPMTNIEDIEDKLNTNDQLPDNINNSLIFFSNEEKFKNYYDILPESTLFFTTFQINLSEIRKSICYIKIEKWSKYHYILIAEEKLGYLTLPLIFFFFYISVPISVYKGYKESLNRLVLYREIYFYKFAKHIILFSIGIGSSAILIYYFLLSYIIYSIYKTYLIINLILLLEGFSIIHFNDSQKKFKKYLLIFFLFDLITSNLSEYIVYFIPYLDNFYLFHLKSLIEHATFLVMIFIYFKTKYIHMLKQYLLEKRLGTVLSIGYKIKNVIYVKIMIFSIIYCSTFIILPFILKIYIKIDNVVETFYVNYFITIILELIFNLVLVIILFPQDLTLFYFLPTIFDYNTFKFEVKIKEKNKESLNISNITRNLLKDEYEEKEYPLIFINPFCKTNNVFNGLHVGLIKKPKLK